MKKMFRFAAVGLMLTALPFTACKDDDDDINCTAEFVATEFNNHLTDVVEAEELYANNQTSANCNNVLNEYREFVDFLKDYESCATETLGYDDSDWNTLIQELEDAINDANC